MVCNSRIDCENCVVAGVMWACATQYVQLYLRIVRTLKQFGKGLNKTFIACIAFEHWCIRHIKYIVLVCHILICFCFTTDSTNNCIKF